MSHGLKSMTHGLIFDGYSSFSFSVSIMKSQVVWPPFNSEISLKKQILYLLKFKYKKQNFENK